MTFYLIPLEKKDLDITDHNIIGEISFKSFHVGIAWKVLQKLIKSNNIKSLSKLKIKDSSGKSWDLSSFLDYLKDYQFIQY